MTTGIAAQIPAGSRGFDCNTTVDRISADKLVAAGFTFAIRYIPRISIRPHDVSAQEISTLHAAGLGVMLVQHVESERSWIPSRSKGDQYGATAAEWATKLLPSGTHVWLDLEGVDPNVPESIVIDYANTWYDRVKHAGHHPGIYVGWHCGISPSSLYYRLKFDSYWGAYNLNADEVPKVRGLMMKQKALVGSTPVHFPIDGNLVSGDKLGSLPIASFPASWTQLVMKPVKS